MRRLARLCTAAALPLCLYAHINGLPIWRTGAPVDDNGLNCSECHTGTRVNFTNGLAVLASAYTPGLTQSIRVDVSDSSALISDSNLRRAWLTMWRSKLERSLPRWMHKFTAIPTGVPDLAMEQLSSWQTLQPPRVLTPAVGVSFLSAGRCPAGTWARLSLCDAAAAAGNHDETAAGDHVFTCTVQAPVLPCNLTGAPTIGQVKNGSRTPPAIAIAFHRKNLFLSSAPVWLLPSCRRKDTGAARSDLQILNLSALRVSVDDKGVNRGRVSYAGVTPGTSGLYQLNLKLPDPVATNPEVRISIGGSSSPPAVHLGVR